MGKENDKMASCRRVMTIANTDIPTLDSREVAPMIDMRHSDLLRNIAHYEEVLTERKIALSDFFIKSEYKDASGKANKCYLLTKMGCEMVANKLTGKKGILFTAEYVKRFNEMEKQHLAEMPSYMIEDPVERARRWADEMEAQDGRIRHLESEIKEIQPKAVFADAVSASKTSILVGDLAKLLHQNGVSIGQKRLFDWLRENGWLMKNGSSRNLPTQRGMEMKLFEIKEGSYVDGNGVNVTTKTPKVTGKGQIYFINKFLSEEAS
jgi:Rha family phage regulatory protein